MNSAAIHLEPPRPPPHECGTVRCTRCGHEGAIAREVTCSGDEVPCPVCHNPRAGFEPSWHVPEAARILL
jgi:hypothetical protein